MVLKKLLMGGSLTLLFASSAHAELFGLPDGRSADPGVDVGAISIEGGYVTGELYDDVDYTSFGARLNYQVSPVLTVFADFSQPELDYRLIDEFDGNAYGGGVYYHLPEQTFLQSLDVAVKASYHTASLDQDSQGQTFNTDVKNIQAVALVSGKEPLSANGLKWYAAVGVQRLDEDYDFNVNLGFGQQGSLDDKETFLSAGAGVSLPIGGGLLYAGVEKANGITYGGGFRYFLQ